MLNFILYFNIDVFLLALVFSSCFFLLGCCLFLEDPKGIESSLFLFFLGEELGIAFDLLFMLWGWHLTVEDETAAVVSDSRGGILMSCVLAVFEGCVSGVVLIFG